MLLLTKGLSHHALDLIALACFANVLFGNHKSETCNALVVGAGEDEKIRMRSPNWGVSENGRKKRLVEEALSLAKLIPLGD